MKAFENMGTYCEHCFQAFFYIPMFMVAGIMAWVTYIYIFEFTFQMIPNIFVRILYTILFLILMGMVEWSYWKVMFTQSGQVPDPFKLPDATYELLANAETVEKSRSILEEFAINLPVCNINLNGSIRYCEKCHCVKPDRCHHCSVCQVCVLKMDHHCPWINNCVSFTNYKYFLLFMIYIIVTSIYVVCTSYETCYKFWIDEDGNGKKLQIVVLFFLAVLLSFSMATLLIYHTYLLTTNQSTIETLRKPLFRVELNAKNYNVGFCKNMKQVFGEDPLLSCVPIRTWQGDGVVFMINYGTAETESLV